MMLDLHALMADSLIRSEDVYFVDPVRRVSVARTRNCLSGKAC